MTESSQLMYIYFWWQPQSLRHLRCRSVLRQSSAAVSRYLRIPPKRKWTECSCCRPQSAQMISKLIRWGWSTPQRRRQSGWRCRGRRWGGWWIRCRCRRRSDRCLGRRCWWFGFGLSEERSTGVEGSAGNVELTDRKVEEDEKSEDGDSWPHFYFILIRESLLIISTD